MALPSSPSNYILQQGNGQTFLSWNIVVGATGYAVSRSLDGVTFSLLSSPLTNSYLDTSVTVGTQYYYKVAAVNGTGTGSYTSAQSIVPTLTGEMSLGQLRLLAQQRSDMVNSQYITVPEWNTYINQSYFELYDILIQAYGNEYYVAAPYQFTTDGSVGYSLPTDFYKLLGVDLNVNSANNAWVTINKFNFIDRNRYVYPQNNVNALGVPGLRYRLVGNNLQFIPTPSSGQILQLWYIPRMSQLLQDTDICDGVSGWTEYIIVDAAIKAMQKEESDVTVLALQKQALIDRIQAAAENRDAGQPDTISDTRRNSDPFGYGWDGPIGGF